MEATEDDIARVCHGLAHELSNTLTYLLPVMEEIGGLHAGLGRALHELPEGQAGPELLALRAQFQPDDVARMDRAVGMGGTRLSQIFRDLRLGSARPAPDRLTEIDLVAALGAAVQGVGAWAWGVAGPGPVLAPMIDLVVELDGPGPARAGVQVEADPVLLGEALRRLVRAGLAWALSVGPGQGVRVGLSVQAVQEGPRARVEALLPGRPADLPSPGQLLSMLCPSESGALRGERGPLGIVVGAHLFRCHGGVLYATATLRGVALRGELPLLR